jgi:lycopene cyclase domain-containing protein
MKIEYLLYNTIIFAGPFALSFLKGARRDAWLKSALPAIAVTLIPFIVWDILVTGRHWWFNEQYISGWRLFGLPLEEWLFFITVPFACLFVWKQLRDKLDSTAFSGFRAMRRVLLAAPLPAVYLIYVGKEYSGITLLALSFTALLDMLLRTDIFRWKGTYLYLSIITIFILIFNGYLTARPVVLYNISYQIPLHIFAIPIEDFGYGYALLLLNAILFQKFSEARHAGKTKTYEDSKFMGWRFTNKTDLARYERFDGSRKI